MLYNRELEKHEKACNHADKSVDTLSRRQIKEWLALGYESREEIITAAWEHAYREYACLSNYKNRGSRWL